MPSAPDLRSDETRYNDERVHQAVAAERERCAKIAGRLNGWGNLATRQSGLAEHIAKVIRDRKD